MSSVAALSAPLEREDGRALSPASETALEKAQLDLERVMALRSRIGDLQRTRVDDTGFATLPAVAPLLPGGALQPGGAYSVVDSTSLVMALLAGPSAAGAWCAVVGEPSFGAEAAARFGIDLERLVLVPHPGDQWLGVTAALADAVAVVVTRPLGRVNSGEAARLGARLRQRGAALIVHGDWPRTDARLRVTQTAWSGIGSGHGYLTSREVTVAVSDRANVGRDRRVRLLLPADGGVEAVESVEAVEGTEAQSPAPAPALAQPVLRVV